MYRIVEILNSHNNTGFLGFRDFLAVSLTIRYNRDNPSGRGLLVSGSRVTPIGLQMTNNCRSPKFFFSIAENYLKIKI